jgi:YVTN family beta-propeller protein
MTRWHGLATARRHFVGFVGLALLILGGLFVPLAHAIRASEAAPEASPGGRGFLLVADTAEQHLYVYRVPGMRLTGEVHGVLLGVHCGTLTLPDGRILLSDTANQAILALRIDEDGKPVVVNSTKAQLGQQAVWASADPTFRYFAVASAIENSAEQVINLIDLQTFKNTQVLVDMHADEEPHPYLGARPLTLFVGLGGVLQSYKVADLIRQGSSTPTSETEIDLGAHGLVIAPKTSRLGISTRAGFNVVDTNCAALGSGECFTLNIPWDLDGRAGGQNFRPRLAYDGVTALGAIAGPVAAPEQWADTPQDIHVLNLRTLEAHRFRLGNGIVPRFALSKTFAVFVTVHPYGDALHLLDVRPQSQTYLKRTGIVDLAPLSDGPVAGQPPTGREARFVAVTPDGRYAFATHGGDGKISVIDIATLSVTKVVQLPTALRGGGYITAVQPSAPIVDLIAR